MSEPQQVIDKSQWQDGPWMQEPDRWEGEHHGFPLLAVRHPRSGHWCGYVAVPPGHPWHQKGYDSVEADVHGGLTYADKCDGQVCHVPKPGQPDDVWWLGFDCAHSGDYTSIAYAHLLRSEAPYDHARAMAAVEDWTVEKYRTLDYVIAECRSLAEQAATVESREVTGPRVTRDPTTVKYR